MLIVTTILGLRYNELRYTIQSHWPLYCKNYEYKKWHTHVAETGARAIELTHAL